MAVDANGRTIAAGDLYMIAGRVRRIEANDLVVVLGSAGTAALRVKPGDLVHASSFLTSTAALAALGALTPAADRLPYFTGASSANWTTVTSFARTLLGSANAAAALSTLGAAAAAHGHDATAIAIAEDEFAGALSGAGVDTVQKLAAWIDANFPV